MNLPSIQKFRGISRAVVNNLTMTQIQFTDSFHIRITQHKIPDIQIFFHTFPMNRFRNNDNPLCTFHRRDTCAAFFPYFAPISLRTGWVKIPCFPSAIGPHACGCTPNSFITASASVCAKNGCSSTWLTIGLIFAFRHKSTSLSG